MLHARMHRTVFGSTIQQLVDQGAKSEARLTTAQHAYYASAYGEAVQAGFVLCAVIITGALISVLFLPKAGRVARQGAVTQAAN